MESVINPTIAYAFISGAFMGKFLGLIPSIVISGVLLYVSDPTIYEIENVKTLVKVVKHTFN